MIRRTVLAAVPALAVGLVVGLILGRTTVEADADAAVLGESIVAPTPTSTTTESPPSTTTAEPTTTTTTTESPPPATTIPPVVVVRQPPTADEARAIADALSPVPPSDCLLPLRDPNLLPGAPRGYRGGIHAGIDFLCDRPGDLARAALDGTVVMAHDGFEDPSPAARDAVLDDAKERGTTPPWTLAMLYGRFVVVDHGQVPGVGHVATIYAHLETIADGVREGAVVNRGQTLGAIGNSGTSSGSNGDGGAIHLHWEIHVDDVFLGAGLDSGEVADVYSRLFDG